MEKNGVNGFNKNNRTSKETLPNPFRKIQTRFIFF